MTASDKLTGNGGPHQGSLQRPLSAEKNMWGDKSVPRTRKEKCQTPGPGPHHRRIWAQLWGAYRLFSGRFGPISPTRTSASTAFPSDISDTPCQKCQTADSPKPRSGWRPGLCRDPPRHHQSIKPLHRPKIGCCEGCMVQWAESTDTTAPSDFPIFRLPICSRHTHCTVSARDHWCDGF
jgi:hypothetical protein